jgi:ribonuclease D
MAERTCEKCGKVFPYPRDLRKHQERKTPCSLIVDESELSATELQKKYDCDLCGRKFSSQSSASRHIRQRCKATNLEDEGSLHIDDPPRRTMTMEAMQAMLEKQQAMLERLVARAELPGVIMDAKVDGRAAMSERDQVIAAAQAARGQVARGAAELAYLLETVGAPPLGGDVRSRG